MRKQPWFGGTGESLVHLPDDMRLREAADRDDVRLSLSVRALNGIFKQEVVPTIGDLRRATDAELGRLPNVGRKTVNEVRELIGYRRNDVRQREAWGKGLAIREREAAAAASRTPPAFEWVLAPDGWLYGPQIDLGRDRKIVTAIAAGAPLDDVAAQFGLTLGRVNQIARNVPRLEAKIAAGRIGKVEQP
jgi:hypothetical protein